MNKLLIPLLFSAVFISTTTHADGFDASLAIQRADIEEIDLNQDGGENNTQAINNAEVNGSFAGVYQEVDSEDIEMDQDGGENNTQAINNAVVDGGFAGVYQEVTADEATLNQKSGRSNTQAINNVKIK